MTIIGLDSSGLVASAAIVRDDTLVAEYTMEYKKTHSETLVPMLDEIVKATSLDIREVDAVAIAAGPGSFTGLRIGSATAKGIAYAIGKPVIPVPTTAGLAYNFYGSHDIISPIMDARRDQVYNGLYTYDEDGLVTLAEQRAIDIHELVSRLNENYKGRSVIFLGDGVPKYKNAIEADIRVSHIYASANLSKQHAGSVAALGARLFESGVYESAFDHAPIN